MEWWYDNTPSDLHVQQVMSCHRWQWSRYYGLFDKGSRSHQAGLFSCRCQLWSHCLKPRLCPTLGRARQPPGASHALFAELGRNDQVFRWPWNAAQRALMHAVECLSFVGKVFCAVGSFSMWQRLQQTSWAEESSAMSPKLWRVDLRTIEIVMLLLKTSLVLHVTCYLDACRRLMRDWEWSVIIDVEVSRQVDRRQWCRSSVEILPSWH